MHTSPSSDAQSGTVAFPSSTPAVRNPARLAVLRRTGLLDTASEEVFDRLTRLAVKLVRVPSSFISLVDADRDFYKSAQGFAEPLATRRVYHGKTFCHYAVEQGTPLVIPDTAADPVYREVPTVRTLGVAAYVGVPILIEGQAIGSFCVIDTKPRQWTQTEIEVLVELAAAAEREIEVRVANRELTRARDEAWEAQRQFESLANSIPQMAWIADARGEILWYNDRWYQFTGATHESMGGRGWVTVHHPDHVDRVVRRYDSAFENAQLWEDVFPLRGRDGEYRWFLSRAVPIRDADGKVVRWFGTNTDITDARKASEERERLLASERAARESAERATQFRDEMLAVVAHDLRNPVQTVAMAASLLLELPLSEDQQKKHLAMIKRATHGMNALIQDLLDVSRIESGRFIVHQQRVDVGGLLDDVIEQFEGQARAKGLSLVRDTRCAASTLLGDRDRLVQVFSNLIGNAIKFTPAGGTITVGAGTADGMVTFAVSDTGIGLAPDALAHVFDRFWQVDRASRAGAGLGLAIVKGIVEAHGGSVQVASEQGKGTTFTFTIPAGDA